MRNLMLLLVAFAPLVSANAQATMPSPALRAFMPPAGVNVNTNLPTDALEPVPVDCAAVLDELIAAMGPGGSLTLRSTLLAGEAAYAESPHEANSGGFDPPLGIASVVDGKLSGSSRVAIPARTLEPRDLTFAFAVVDGRAMISWTHQGRSYSAPVDHCSNRLWTAASESSAIAIKLAKRRRPAG
jgi:hypothetical protein